MDEKNKKKAAVFTREALAESKEFAEHKDIVRAVLSDGEYTKKDAAEKIRKYLNSQLK